MTMPPPVAPDLHRPIVFDQRWTDLAFLHWAVDPAVVAPFLPSGTRPDVYDGATYVGLVPFLMRDAGPFQHLPAPYLGTFLETNVRLYSVDDAGRHGVVFRSLECQRLAVTLFARLGLRLPYTWAAMTVTRTADTRRYETRRRWPRPAVRSRLELRIGGRTQATDLEHFLSDRWGLHSRYAGRTLWTPNRHGSWVFHEAEVIGLDDGLIGAAGLSVTGPPTLRALWSPGVHSVFGAPVVVRS